MKQGYVIAPDLFNGVIDNLMRRLLRRCSLGIQLGEYQLTDLDYADDIAIFAPSACVLQEALTSLQEEANLVGMQISWPKTKLMAITQPHQPSAIEDMQQGSSVCRFLHISSDRRLTHLVEERVKRGRRTAYALFGAGLRGSNGIGMERSILIHHSYVYPVFMYGLESMVLDKRSIDTLATFHMPIIKELPGLPTRIDNAAAYLMANQLPLPALLHIETLTLLCNIAISKNNSLEILLKRKYELRVRKSWAMNAQDTLDIYDMSSIDDIFESDNPRLMKKHFKQVIRKEWNRRLKEECAGKSSLRWPHLPE